MQRVFDVENEKDMQDLWDILPDEVVLIKQRFADGSGLVFFKEQGGALFDEMKIIAINWHDKTEITRPIQEATEDDLGKLCAFWDDKEPPIYGILTRVRQHVSTLNIFQYQFNNEDFYTHCRRLTPQEIKELC